MRGFLANLKPFDASKLRALPLGIDHEQAAEQAIDVKAGLSADLKYATRAKRRTFKNLVRVANAAKHIERLPDAGETFHCVVKGNYASWDIVPAISGMVAPGSIDDLHVVTLGFSKANAAELLAMLDDGRIGTVAMLCSCYFKAADSDIYAPMVAALEERWQRILAMRSHAKLILFALSDGRRITIESSANLRSCRNIEQFTMTNDPGLYDFHAGWIEQIFSERTDNG